MKKKVSISIEEELIKKIKEKASTGIYRNSSHFIELAVMRLLEE